MVEITHDWLANNLIHKITIISIRWRYDDV